MIVHLLIPTPSYEQNVEKYEKILQAIRSLGHVPTRSTTTDAPTLIEMGMGILDQEECELLCERDLNLLKGCDAVIADTMNRATFGVGYQAALSLAGGKPTLVLEATGGVKGSFISGLKHPFLTRESYDDDTIEDIVICFLKKVQK